MFRIHPAVPKSILPISPFPDLLSTIRVMERESEVGQFGGGCEDVIGPYFYDEWQRFSYPKLGVAHEKVLSALRSQQVQGAAGIEQLFIDILRPHIYNHAVERVESVMLLKTLQALERKGHYVLDWEPVLGTHIVELGPAGAPGSEDILAALRRMTHFTTVLESTIACDIVEDADLLFEDLPCLSLKPREIYQANCYRTGGRGPSLTL